jgi:hypothetical protein
VTTPLDAPPHWLLGVWRLFRADAPLDFAPGVRMEFCPGGQLRYHITLGDREQIIELLYRVDGDVLLTDNPSHPHATAVRFSRGEGNVLILDFAGPRAWLIREEVNGPAEHALSGGQARN